MKRGDKVNWACIVLGIMMLFMAINMYILSEIASDKYRAVIALFGLNVWSGIICLLLAGVFSIFVKKSDAVLGALLGIALFIAVSIFSMFMFAQNAARMSVATARVLTTAGYVVVLLSALGIAFFREPKEQKGSNQVPENIGTTPPNSQQ
jgi:drug/metabolite transporter (DMT)-like permease